MARGDRERWDRRYRERSEIGAPDPMVLSADPFLPRRGRAIDVAGGSGRHALWLARRGLDVTLADVSPVALDMAAERAQAEGVEVATLEIDFEDEVFPAGPWQVILDFHYLHRPLFSAFQRELAPGGWLLFSQPTRKNLERHEKPPARFLLEEGELAGLAAGLEVVSYEEGWSEAGRHEARLLARKPAA